MREFGWIQFNSSPGTRGSCAVLLSPKAIIASGGVCDFFCCRQRSSVVDGWSAERLFWQHVWASQPPLLRDIICLLPNRQLHLITCCRFFSVLRALPEKSWHVGIGFEVVFCWAPLWSSPHGPICGLKFYLGRMPGTISSVRSDRMYTLCWSDPDHVRFVRCTLARGSLLHQGRGASIQPLAGVKGTSNSESKSFLIGRVLLDWCSSLVRPEPLRWMGMLHANCAKSKLEFPGRAALHASHGRCTAEPWPQLQMLHVLHPMGCIPGTSRYTGIPSCFILVFALAWEFPSRRRHLSEHSVLSVFNSLHLLMHMMHADEILQNALKCEFHSLAPHPIYCNNHR